MRRLLAPLVLAVAAACGPTRAAGDTRWVTVKRDAMVLDVDVSGSLRAVDSISIGPPGLPGVWNYKIAMMPPEGQEIAEGQPVLMFDTTELNRRLEQKVAERDSAAKQLEMKRSSTRVAREDNALALAEARAELRKAELKADAPEDITAVVELEKAKLDLELAREKIDYLKRKATATKRSDAAEIARWRSQRDRAEERVTEITASIEQMTVKATRAGTIIYETNWQGEKKKVGDNAWRGEKILQIASLAAMEAEGEIDEVDASKVVAGHPVSLRLDAQPDVELLGTIREISRTVQRQSPDNPLKIVRLEIELVPNESLRLRPGMRFRGKAETERLEGVLMVPLEAIIATPQGPVARRRTAAGFEEVEVTLGRRNAHHVEVTAGLAEEDEVQAQDLGDEEASR